MEWWILLIILPLAVILLAVVTAILPWSAFVTASSSGEAGFCLKLLKRIPVLNIRTSLAGQTEIGLAGFWFRLKKKENKKENGDILQQDTDLKVSLPLRLKAALGALTPDTIIVLLRYFRGMIGDADSCLEISGELGFSDPAATGIVCGMAYGLGGVLGVAKVNIKPNFCKPVVEGKVKLCVTVIPVIILLRTVRTAFHPAIRRVWIALVAPQRHAGTRGLSMKGGI
ncbi:DUF2953 domain-containing protein [Phosphitispora sp. TUW77]|uniref:DUF2953 domain-containing protein n=1 Tax=Phosphitispora sp. TUW77 TaxID=3152361 RepID=UPI003AB644A9